MKNELRTENGETSMKNETRTENELKLSDVAASLKYGEISKKAYYPLWIALTCAGLFGALLLLIWNPFSDRNGGYIALLVGCVVFALLFGYILAFDIKIRTTLKKTLRDGMRLKAEGHVFDERKDKGQVKLLVKFKDGKKKVHKTSDDYGKVFCAYCGREIDVVYSKKYNDVLILKMPE